MSQDKEESFIRQAFQALIERGVAKQEYFSPSTVTDNDLLTFEKTFNVTLPSLLKAYLKVYCFEFTQICAPVLEDIDSFTLQQPEEYSTHLLWLELLSVPKENPLQDLYSWMEGFREVAIECCEMTENSIAHLLPIGDWGAGAGPLCIDLKSGENNVDIGDEDTWSLQFFDHEEQWNEIYLSGSGTAEGQRVVPNFKTLLEWYFYGEFDSFYEAQEGEKPDYSTFIR